MGTTNVHGEPKFTDGQLRVFTDLLRMESHCKEMHHRPEMDLSN